MGGKNTWFVPDGYLPGDSSHGVPSHEAACVLNTGIREAQLAITFYSKTLIRSGPCTSGSAPAEPGTSASTIPQPSAVSRCHATSPSPTPFVATSQ